MLMSNIPVIIFLFSLSWIVGMCIYAVYSDCDPLKSGYTKSADAILPFYIEDKYSFIPGLMGIFLSTLFNSALILNVSNLNSLATVTWEDFLSHMPHFKGMTDKNQLKIIKFIGTIYGFMIMGVGFSVQFLSGVIESAQLMTSATSGPLLGVFLLAILVPFANWKGASVGMIVSHIIILFVTFGHLTIDQTAGKFLETSIDGCTNQSFSSDITKPTESMILSLARNKPIIVDHWTESLEYSSTITPEANPTIFKEFVNHIFSISYMYYSFFGTCITVLVGIVVSLFTMSKKDAYEPKYVHPFIHKLAKMLPGHQILFIDELQGPLPEEGKTFRNPPPYTNEHVNYGYDNDNDEKIKDTTEKRNISEEGNNLNINIVYSASNIKQSHEAEKYRKLADV